VSPIIQSGLPADVLKYESAGLRLVPLNDPSKDKMKIFEELQSTSVVSVTIDVLIAIVSLIDRVTLLFPS
jgi:hypothetical protein